MSSFVASSWFRPRIRWRWDFHLEINSQLLPVLLFFRFSLGNNSRTPDDKDWHFFIVFCGSNR